MKHLDHTYAVILAGGGGTRLWPLSRTSTPKQFLNLIDNKRSMMQVTADRVEKIVGWEKIIVVTNTLYYEDVCNQLPKVPKENIIAEPEKKDTALAMLVGALFAQTKDPQAVVINAASDHAVRDEKEYVRIMQAAAGVASEKDSLVTVGITPTFATSAFGYIKIGEHLKKISDESSLFQVASFTEKPDMETARAFISTGEYFWNANMYVWTTENLKKAFQVHMPKLLEKAQSLTTLSAEEFHAALPEVYKDAESISIDYAVSEKAENLVLIPGDFGWSDVGDWKVVYDLGKKDDAHNVTPKANGDHVLAIESTGNLIHTSDRLIAVVGLENMIVVDTGEIVMICPKERSQDVKKLVEQLTVQKKEKYL